MEDERRPAGFHRLSRLLEKFKNSEYRHSYVASHTRRFLARQMRKFRGEKSQEAFGDLIGKQQTVVSRLEDPAYGKWTLQTLFDVAKKLDVAVFVRFVDHWTFLKLSEDLSEDASMPKDYASVEADEAAKLSNIGEAARAYRNYLEEAQSQQAQQACPPTTHPVYEAANQNIPPYDRTPTVRSA